MADLAEGPGARHQLARLRAAGRAGGRRERQGRARPASRSRTRETITHRRRRRRPRAGSRYLTPEELDRQVAAGLLDGARGGSRRAGQPAEGRGRVGPLRRERHGPGRTACSAARSAASRTSWSSTTRPITPTASGARSRTRTRTTLRRGGGRRGVLQGGHGLGRRARPHPQAARHQLLRRPLGDAVLPRPGRARTRTAPFPWVVSDFGLIDAIESGLVKIPQLAVRDTTGAEIPGYFNIWRWILPQAHARGAGRQARLAPSRRRS